MSQGNSLEQSSNNSNSKNQIEISSIISSNSSEQLANILCDPLCDTRFHPVPDDVQMEILNNADKMKRYFNREAFQDIQLYRAQKDSDYVPLCKTIYQAERPSAAKDVYGKKHFLLNPQVGEYMQRVNLEMCENETLPCTEIKAYIPPGTETRCETQYFRKGMVAVNPESLQTYEIVVRVPAGCNCFIQKSWNAKFEEIN